MGAFSSGLDLCSKLKVHLINPDMRYIQRKTQSTKGCVSSTVEGSVSSKVKGCVSSTVKCGQDCRASSVSSHGWGSWNWRDVQRLTQCKVQPLLSSSTHSCSSLICPTHCIYIYCLLTHLFRCNCANNSVLWDCTVPAWLYLRPPFLINPCL